MYLNYQSNVAVNRMFSKNNQSIFSCSMQIISLLYSLLCKWDIVIAQMKTNMPEVCKEHWLKVHDTLIQDCNL